MIDKISIDDYSNVIEWMVQNNGDEYNLAKSAEEFQELGLAIQQYLLRKEDSDPKKRSLQAIIDEIGDCLIRMAVLSELEHLFPDEKVAERINFKIDKFNKYITEKRYTQI